MALGKEQSGADLVDDENHECLVDGIKHNYRHMRSSHAFPPRLNERIQSTAFLPGKVHPFSSRRSGSQVTDSHYEPLGHRVRVRALHTLFI